ncbi:membrane-targeted effector domain-containing toxin [Pseudomonas sp. SJZ131]|uniref:membrane-targeted effector domain-containing toxin n=1 Tax=Pseudomonas sp. SJZ131 TaxID=2572895 RepID=UPI00119A653B|nr:membrane-targeted effector domain-containing toxin [Pseudomonas sp. SJZ131]TWD49331.1 hypothetical protein FBY12_1737 [Pseudomonas sp. SJZ131]
MSTSATPTPAPSFEDIKGYLNQIGHQLLKSDTPLLPQHPPSAEQRYLDRLNGILRTHREQFLRKCRAHYQALEHSDLHSEAGKNLLAALKISLDNTLLDLDLRENIDGEPAKSFMTFEGGFTALGHEARLAVQDRVLHPHIVSLLDKLTLGPALRPGLYALQFTYQANTVELAGAFVVTENNTPVVTDLLDAQSVGQVLLFTLSRGIEAFDSLTELNAHLLHSMQHASACDEFMRRLPTRYQALDVGGIWPLQLAAIDDKPLFEHLYDTLIAKRSNDIERALSLDDNPQHDSAALLSALDLAVTAALPDLGARRELHAQALLERSLRHSAPDWYRSASEARRAELALHLAQYDLARQRLLDLLGPAANVQALAQHQWLERLSDDLQIEDLQPQHLRVVTRRYVAGFGVYEHSRNLIGLALRGAHTGDELPGSAFLEKTTLSYLDAPLHASHQDLTPAWLAEQLTTLQPRVDFAQVQAQLQAREPVRLAIEELLGRRINALAYSAFLQGHLREDDLELIQQLRVGGNRRLTACTLSLHGAQLQDLWLLRLENSSGAVQRLLLCLPETPQGRHFVAFDSELACQLHILGWAQNHTGSGMADYLIQRLPLRFRQSMRQFLAGLSFKPDADQHQEVLLNTLGSHADCLKAMAEHVLATRVDDYDFSTPLWYRSTTALNRKKLATVNEEAEGILRTFNDHAASGSGFPDFDAYLHEQAKKSLNLLLKRPANDVDPDTVWAFSPPAIIGNLTPKPLTYTQLYRDGYADGVGFLDEKFSRSAQFKGPPGVDLSLLTAENVARSVTGVWVGQRYIDKVRAQLQSPESAGFALRRNSTLLITQRLMAGAALECHLQGHITGVDLQWLELAIASLGDTAAQTRNNYAVHRLMIDGEWVIDTFLFSHAKNPPLLYTPQAPDGITFREARLFNYLLKKQPGMLAYLSERVGVQAQSRVRGFLLAAQTRLPEQLNKTSVSPARYDPTRNAPVVPDLRHALYNMKLQRKIDNVNATTVNRHQMISGIIWTCVEWVTAIATAPFPILSLSAGLLLAFKDAMLALHAYNQGDTSAALEHFAGYLLNSAGALFTDLRPALRSLKPLKRSPRLSTAGAEPQRAMQLISALEPAAPTALDLRPVIFEGRRLWAPKTPDALGRYLLYRLDAHGQWLSTARLATPNAQGLLVRSGVSGGGPKFVPVPETPGPHTDYGMPQQYWARIEHAMDPQMRAKLIEQSEQYFDTPFVMLHSAAKELSSARVVYLQKADRLAIDAQRFFDDLAPLPTRADAPVIEPATPFAQLLGGDALAGNKPLVIGAVPGSIASKQLLIANLDALIDNGFKRLYLEFIPGDVFHLKLQNLNRGKSWRHIEQHLKAIDSSLGFAPDAPYSYLALVRKAREKGLQIGALDASTSYQLDDVLLLAEVSPTTPRDNNVRNFYSHQVIAADIADTPQDRWVALVEPTRLTTYAETPGLADLFDAVALRVEDVAADQPAGIWADTAGETLAKADYRMTLPTAYKAPAPVAPISVTAVARTEHFSEFDISPSLRERVARLRDEPHGLDSRYAPMSADRNETFFEFIRLRSSLKTRAEQFFTDYSALARSELPVITTSTTPESFIKQIGDSRLPGLVIGEAHAHESSKALLRKQMKKIKDAGFKTLYVEHLLTDLHQAELDVFHQTQWLAPKLKAYLKYLDSGHMGPFYDGPNTFSQVVQAAGKYGLRVRALDCTASYHLKGISDPNTSRNMMFSYFASRVIEADQLARGPHKWLAFVGNAHGNNNLGVPGLAEMLGTVSLQVRDVAPTLSKGIHRGYWETDPATLATRALRSDFKLEVGTVGMATPARIISVSRSRLTRPGHYLIERRSPAETFLVHSSRTEGIVATPIEIDDNGLFFINRWGKQAQRFKYLNELCGMLESEVPLTPAP